MRPDPSFAAVIIDLLRLRCGPQALAYSRTRLLKLVLLAFALDFIATHLLDPGDDALARLAVGFGLGLLLPWWLLSWRGGTARYVQTLTALLSTGIVLSLVFLPLALLAISSGLADPAAAPGPRQALVAWLILATVVWKIAVTANIWRHALDWPMTAGVGMSLLLFVFEFGVDRLLFGHGAT